jgi:RNA polymerase sigma factor (sigma-70 family)
MLATLSLKRAAMNANSDHRSAVAEYFSEIEPDACGTAEYLLPDLVRFYRTSRTALFYRAVALVQDKAEAEDLIQEAFLRLLSEIRRGGSIRSLLNWTKTVLRNIALNHIEHARVASNVVVDGLPMDDLAAPDRIPSAEQSLISRERHVALGSALALLSSVERDCVLMFAEGCSYRRIADEKRIAYGVAVATVRRSLRKIRRELAARGHEQTDESCATPAG